MAVTYDSANKPAVATPAGGASPQTYTSNSFSPQAGEIVVLVVSTNMNQQGTTTFGTPTNTGTALTWTSFADSNLQTGTFGGRTTAWWAFNSATQASITVSVVATSATHTLGPALVGIQLWGGANTTAPIGTVTNGSSTTSPLTISITPSAVGSGLACAVGDWSGAAAPAGVASGTGLWRTDSQFTSTTYGSGLGIYGTSATAIVTTPSLSAVSLAWTSTGTPAFQGFAYEILAAAAGGVKAPPPVISRRRRAGRGVIRVLKGPINPVPIPKIIVSKPVQSLSWHRRGVSKVSKGPVNPVPIPKIIVSPPHRGRLGRIEVSQGPVNPVPIPHSVVSKPPPPRRGRRLFVKGATPAQTVPLPPTLVSSPAKVKRRGLVRLFQGPVNPVPVPPKVVSRPPRWRGGTIRVFIGKAPTGPAVVPLPPTLVTSPAKVKRRGIARVFQGPVNPVAVPPKVVSKPPPPRRGRIQLLRGSTPAVVPVAPATTLVSRIGWRQRFGRLAFWRGLTPVVPPAPVVIPTEFTARQPIPYWTAHAPRSWWGAGQPGVTRWEVGEPQVAWSASQAIFEPLDAENPASDWQTGAPRT